MLKNFKPQSKYAPIADQIERVILVDQDNPQNQIEVSAKDMSLLLAGVVTEQDLINKYVGSQADKLAIHTGNYYLNVDGKNAIPDDAIKQMMQQLFPNMDLDFLDDDYDDADDDGDDDGDDAQGKPDTDQSESEELAISIVRNTQNKAEVRIKTSGQPELTIGTFNNPLDAVRFLNLKVQKFAEFCNA